VRVAAFPALEHAPNCSRLALNELELHTVDAVNAAKTTDAQVYFCDPQSPWQRGSIENTNLLLRQYFPRGTDLAPIIQAQLDQVSLRLNQRPRKTLASRLQRVNSKQVLRRPPELARLIGR
jgi:IS30 family transposase